MSTYVWCEDSGSGLCFWKEIFGTLFPDYIVETKMNNTGLRKAVRSIEDDTNRYYIIVDQAIDNPDVLREILSIKKCSKEKENVYIVDLHSFEFVLLSFRELENWVFAPVDPLKEKRKSWLEFAQLLVKLWTENSVAAELDKLREECNCEKKNTEQMAAFFLENITRNTGFETTKGQLGPCFVCDCCEWIAREEDDICGLDKARISGKEKISSLIENSVLKTAFEKAGLL